MSGYLCFPNNLKDIEDHVQTYMISCNIIFQLMVAVFKENLNLQVPLIFYSSIRFVYETVFISRQIAMSKFGTLLEVSDKLITKFNIFSYTILQFRFKTVWKNSKLYCMTLKTVARQFCLKGHCLYHKIRDELLETRKDLKIKHSVSSPLYKVWGNLFQKNVLHEGTNFFLANFWGDVLYGD